MDADLELLKAENEALRGRGADLERTVERPQAIGETHDAPLSGACPSCGGWRFDDQRVVIQHQTAIPRRRSRGDSTFTLRPVASAASRLRSPMQSLVAPVKRHAGHERLAAFLETHLDELYVYLQQPGMDATNWRGEQARPFARRW